MKRFLLALALTVVAISAPAWSANVGVSINIGQPGFYGQLDIGDIAPPPVIYERPVIVQRAPRGVLLAPLYLRVPPGHARNWRHYCSRYNACGRPVYFVKDDWYNNEYAPRYREEHDPGRREEHREDRRDDRRDERRDERWEDRRDDRRDNRRDERRDDRDDKDHNKGHKGD